jgi:hypothetical protein
MGGGDEWLRFCTALEPKLGYPGRCLMPDDLDDDLDIGDCSFIDLGVSVEVALYFALGLIAVIATVRWWLE